MPFGKKVDRSLITTCTVIPALITGMRRNVGDVIQRVAAEMQAAPSVEVANEAVKGDVVVASGGLGGCEFSCFCRNRRFSGLICVESSRTDYLTFLFTSLESGAPNKSERFFVSRPATLVCSTSFFPRGIEVLPSA